MQNCTRFFTTILICILFNALVSAQTSLSTLTAESGNRSVETSACWAFGALSYTSTSSQVINGSWSMRSNSPTSLNTGACWVKSPWIKITNNQVSLKLKFEASGSATIRRVIASYISYNDANQFKESAITRFDSVEYTTSGGNSLPTTTNNISFTIPSSIINNNNVYKIMISFVGTGGTTRYNIDDIAIPGLYFSDPSNNCFPLSLIQDADNDGVADNEDAYPNDANRAYNNYYPSANGYGTLLFEDLWPGLGDYDFNDLVLSYRTNKVTNAQNKVVELKIVYIVRATGSSFQNGFAFQLDNLNPNLITAVTGTKTSNASWLGRNANGAENGQDFANIIVYDNINKFLINPGSIGVNTKPGSRRVAPDTTNLTVSFSTGANAIGPNDININPYLIVNQIRGKEIHLPGFRPTSKASTSYFGLNQDNTQPGANIFYKSKTNLPWALDIPVSIPYLIEGMDFLKGYKNFGKWAASNGSTNSDWHTTSAENRDSNNLFND
jgi:LruC domain-containing protein